MIDPPLVSDDPAVLADWLELITILSAEQAGFLSVVLDSADIAQDAEIEDISANDISRDLHAEAITEAIFARRTALGPDAYPFEMSANGECLHITPNRTYGHSTYLACLMISHSWRSGKLVTPASLSNDELTDARIQFEVMTAVAAVGLASGPSFLLGTNRAGAQGLRDRIAHICNTVGEGNAREVLHPAAPAAANDDGVDVLAVHQEIDGPPHRTFWFCQSASGENYPNKPIINQIDGFLDIWFSERPAHTSGALFFPAAVETVRAIYLTRRLGHLCHRLRMPHYAQIGFAMISENVDLIHYVEDIYSPVTWLDQCLVRIESEL